MCPEPPGDPLKVIVTGTQPLADEVIAACGEATILTGTRLLIESRQLFCEVTKGSDRIILFAYSCAMDFGVDVPPSPKSIGNVLCHHYS